MRWWESHQVGLGYSVVTSAYRADRSAIRRAEASVFPSFFRQLKKLIIFLFEFSLPGTNYSIPE